VGDLSPLAVEVLTYALSWPGEFSADAIVQDLVDAAESPSLGDVLGAVRELVDAGLVSVRAEGEVVVEHLLYPTELALERLGRAA